MMMVMMMANDPASRSPRSPHLMVMMANDPASRSGWPHQVIILTMTVMYSPRTIGPNVIIHPSIDMIAIAMMMMINNAPPGATSSSTLNSVPAVADHIPQALVHQGHHHDRVQDDVGDVPSPCAGWSRDQAWRPAQPPGMDLGSHLAPPRAAAPP